MCFPFPILAIISTKALERSTARTHRSAGAMLPSTPAYPFLLPVTFWQTASGVAQPAAMTLWRLACLLCCEAESEGWGSLPAVSAGASSIPCQEKGPPRNRWGPQNQHPTLFGKTNKKCPGDTLAKTLDQHALEWALNPKADGQWGYVPKQQADAGSRVLLLGRMEHE